MKCSCDIKLLFSQGCKCGGFAAEQAARSAGSSAIVSVPATSTDPFTGDVYVRTPMVAKLSSTQEQVLVAGKLTKATYWIRSDAWADQLTNRFSGRVMHGGTSSMQPGEQVDNLMRTLLVPADPPVVRLVYSDEPAAIP